MKNHKPERQQTVSFKVTKSIKAALVEIRLRISKKREQVITHTDVIEEAVRCLAKREKVEIPS